MASEEKSRGQEVIGCDLCQEPVFRICKQCRIRLCITCLSVHVQEKSKTPHFIDDYGKDDDDGEFCFCDSHPKYECCVYCTTCDAQYVSSAQLSNTSRTKCRSWNTKSVNSLAVLIRKMSDFSHSVMN